MYRRELKTYGYVVGLAAKERTGQQVGVFFLLTPFHKTDGKPSDRRAVFRPAYGQAMV